MLPHLLSITEQSPFWSLPVIYGRLLSRTRAYWEINLRKERHNPDSKSFFYWLDYLVIKSAGHYGRNRPNTIKGRFTQYDFLACDKLTPCTRARVLTHPLLVCLIFPKYSPVRNKNVITENLPTGLDLTRLLFRDTEQTNPYGLTTKASLS